jgi:hypothetical protein
MVYCCAFGCNNGGTTPGISFFKFPKFIPAKKEWIRRVSPSRLCAVIAVCSLLGTLWAGMFHPRSGASPTTWCAIWEQTIEARCNCDALSPQKSTGRTEFYRSREKEETWGLLGFDRLLIFPIVERLRGLREQVTTRNERDENETSTVY